MTRAPCGFCPAGPLRIGEQHQSKFLKPNPQGVAPVLVHDGNVIN
jgi:glutathione S-transferase